MAFADLLEHVGGMGRFQVASVLLLALPVLMLASHNLLQNFTAAVGHHRCRLGWEVNATTPHLQDLLKVSVPGDDRCRRFVTPQWWLLEANGTGANGTWPETEPFGRRALLTWCYLQLATMGTCSSFAPTFPVYCLFRFLTGMAFSGVVLNSVSLSLEWMPTRARALVGTFMGYCYTGGQFLLAGIASSALRSYMQQEMPSSRSRYTVVDLVRTPVVRRISCCLCFVWFSTSFAYYGLAMDLQNFDFNIYIIQLIFGAVDIPAKLVSILTITFVGRRFTQSLALLLAGLAILANILVPRDLRTLRTALAVFGKGCLASSFNCVFLYTGELYPTVIRQTGMGLANTMARLGSITAPLVKMGGEVFPALPFIIYGVAPVVAGLVAIFLPETRDMALPETVEEVES
ncbi:solute carrier family 22 member 6-A-like, partial [Egretta garzetta]|uniref:solute carrier family 22 member 6-A-like n=1 Tax=Egretta garzetta TaxID=188379 RepID=UPI00051EE14A